MKDFENVDRYEVVANCEKGYWLEAEGEFVEYSDYKTLLDAYNYLKNKEECEHRWGNNEDYRVCLNCWKKENIDE